MLKRLLLSILTILLLQSISYSATWEKVPTANSKSAYLDTQSVKTNFPFLLYSLKYEKNGYDYIFVISSNYNQKTSYIISVEKYNSNGEFIAEYEKQNKNSGTMNQLSETEKMEVIAQNSINEAIYNRVCLIAKNNAKNIDSTEKWNNYVENIKTKINQNWKNQKTEQGGTINVKINLILNSKGEIISNKITESSGSKAFDEKTINYVCKSAPFGNLPTGYKGDAVTLNLNLIYLQFDNFKKDGLSISDEGVLNYSITKEKYGIWGRLIKSVIYL